MIIVKIYVNFVLYYFVSNKMFSLSSNKYVTLRSNSSKDLYLENYAYDFTNQLCTTLNYSNKTEVASAEIHLPLNFRQEKDQKKLRQIFVLTDLIDDSIVGSSRLNILKVISVDLSTFVQEFQVELFQNLFFYPLAQNSINNIRIQITDPEGNILKTNKTYLRPTDETFIVL